MFIEFWPKGSWAMEKLKVLLTKRNYFQAWILFHILNHDHWSNYEQNPILNFFEEPSLACVLHDEGKSFLKFLFSELYLWVIHSLPIMHHTHASRQFCTFYWLAECILIGLNGNHIVFPVLHDEDKSSTLERLLMKIRHGQNRLNL